MIHGFLVVLAIAALAIGLGLATIGLYGLLRMPAILHQLHPAGLVTGPAVILVLLASIAGSVETVTSSVLVILFLLITSPLSTHAIARAAYHQEHDGQDADEQPPSPGP